jgi:hypothetical protein
MTSRSKKIGTVRKREKAKEPAQKNIVRVLFYALALSWLGYGIYVYYDMAVANNNTSSADLAVVFILINMAAFFSSGQLLLKMQRSSWYFAIATASLNLIFNLMNYSVVFLLLSSFVDAAILWLLYRLRRSYL